MRGHSRLLTVSEVGCSRALSAAICPIPKLVRVRFPSPALIDESPAQGMNHSLFSSGPQEAFRRFRARCVPDVSSAAWSSRRRFRARLSSRRAILSKVAAICWPRSSLAWR